MGIIMNGRLFTLLVVAVVVVSLTACSRKPSESPDGKMIQQLEQRAGQGDAEAQNQLGGMYYTGQGVKQDLTQAAFWAEKAALQGRADAQVNLAIMYFKGEGVTQDYKHAYAWWHLATANTDISVGGDISRVAEKLSPQQLSEAKKLVVEIQRRIDRSSQ